MMPAMSSEPTRQRIVESAIELADEGGFEGVRLRELAARSGVALGTLYARFRSKEDILVAALEEEFEKLDALLANYPAAGDTPHARVMYFFTLATTALFARQNFARAVLRSVSSGEPEVAEKVLCFHERVTGLIVSAVRGARHPGGEPSEHERRLGFLLQQIWFGALVGWMGGMTRSEEIVPHMAGAAELLLAGYEALRG